jgi:DNA-binding PadR family transcriptional regulator
MAGDNVQMFVLGSLTQGEAHGYQLVARAKKWGVDDWAGFGSGSIYNALRTLAKRGLIVECGTEQHGGYAPATVYGITAEGRKRLLELLHETACEVAGHDPFDIVTAFIGILPVEQRRELIEAHIAAIRQRLESVADHRTHMQEHVAGGAPYDWVLAAMEKGRRGGNIAIESALELLTRCEAWQPPEPLARGGVCPLEDTNRPSATVEWRKQ